jgi:hypothetical protein
MTMKARFLAICAAVSLTACTPGGNLRVYPTAGPIAKASPGIQLKGKTIGRDDDGEISFVLPDGATCKGLWFVTNPQTIGRAASGTGGGACSNGATFEMVFKADGKRGRAQAEDSNGNVYRIEY